MRRGCRASTCRSGTGCGPPREPRRRSSPSSMPPWRMRLRTRRCASVLPRSVRSCRRGSSRPQRRLRPFTSPRSISGGRSFGPPTSSRSEGSRRSAMKTILVPAEDHDSMAAVLQAAWLVARRVDSYVEGFAVQPAASDFAAVDPLSSLTMPQIADSDAQIERDARQLFESFMASNNVPPAPPPFPPQRGRSSYAWVRPGGGSDTFIGSYVQLFDLIVIVRPGRAPQNPRMEPLEAALFESGRPVLIASSRPPKELGR